MPITKSRQIAKLFKPNGIIKESLYDSDAIVTSAQLGVTAAAGTTTYSSADTLPALADNGDQALVTSTNRLYIYSNGGWYNIALINSTPYWITEADGSYTLSTTGDVTTITILAQDSDGINVVYTAVTDSDFDNIATIIKDSDNGRTFTITPTDSENGTAVAGTGTVTFKATDGVNLVSTLSTFSLTFITTIANSNYTTLLAKADSAGTDNQVDASTNNHTITENGNITSTAFTPYHPGGYSVAFDGSDDYIGFDNGYIATNSTWWNSSGFTLELWFYKTVSTGTTGTVFDNRQSSTNGFLFTNKNTGWDLYLNGSYLFQNVGTEKVGQWVHLALVASGTTLTLYENGTSLYTTGSAPNTSSYAYFGRSQNTVGAVQYSPRGTNVDWPGYMYDIRISSGSRYTTAFTPSETPHENDSNTILLAFSSPMLKDKSSNNHEITAFGDGISTARFTPHDYDPYTKAEFGGSVYFDGSGDYLTFAPGSGFAFGTGDFTIECWLYLDSSAVNQHIIDARNSSQTGNWVFGWAAGTSNGTLGYYTGSTAMTMGSSWGTNRWYHLAVTREGTTLKGFVDGVQVNSITDSRDYNVSPTTSYIGDRYSATNPFTGYISDLRVVKGTAVYTSAFTPPTAPLTAITNTQLLTCTNKNFFWDAAGTTRLVNQTAVEKQAGNFASSVSYYFDGSGDYIDVQTPNLQSDYTFGKNGEPFTIEFWIKPNSNSNTQFWFNASGGAASWSTSNGHHFFIYLASGNVNIEFNIGNNLTTMSFSASLINTAAWQHMAWAYDGTTHRVFLNGTQRASSVASMAAVTAGTYTVRWGRHADLGQAGYFAGYMQDMRVTKGLARYTATFTPPTAEFDG